MSLGELEENQWTTLVNVETSLMPSDTVGRHLVLAAEAEGKEHAVFGPPLLATFVDDQDCHALGPLESPHAWN